MKISYHEDINIDNLIAIYSRELITAIIIKDSLKVARYTLKLIELKK